ncbi:hypothetical protein GOP47_0023189 [Adiantum capillus-veneris]|uniref:Uncharacterized protein n=1 Tax=Adiantum capillus-veneris TaxID=13818 RepID=A0A9D4Z699_ADICA|nr:hypothetical protein GOP47_0023189 [Adiantum capillus-veneris]
MEILSDMASHRQCLFDAIEPGLMESFWDPPLQVVEPQAGSTYMLEALSRSGSSNSSLLHEMVAKLDGFRTKKPICVSNLQPLSCQPYIKKRSCKGGWKPSKNYAVKREIGSLLNDSLVFVNASPVLINHSPELSTNQMFLGSKAMISPSSMIVNNQILQDSLSVLSYGDGELPYLYGQSASEEGDLAHPYAKSPVDSTSISIGSSESSTSNEVLGSSEIQLMDTLFDQSIILGYATQGSETWLEDPFPNMAVIQSYTNDGCLINDPNIEGLAVDDKRETFTHVYDNDDASKAAHSQGFLGYTDCHQGSNGISLPLNERNEVLKHPRIDFEGSFMQSHTLATAPEGKILIQGSISPSGCTQFCLPQPIFGPSSCGNNTTHNVRAANDGFGALPAINTFALGIKPLDRYTDNRQLKEMQETSGVQSCCSYAIGSGIAPQIMTSVKSEDSMDTYCGKNGVLGSSASKLCRQYDERVNNDHMEIGLVNLLTAALAVARRDMHLASVILVRLKDMVSCSDNTMQRVVSYFVQALERRVKGVKGVDHTGKSSSNFQGDNLAAFQILHEIFPYIKFGHFTANQAILEAVQGARRVHIVDFEILEGIQWPAFMQALVSRKGSPPELHITALWRPTHEHGIAMVHKTCKRLSEFASAMCLPFSYSLLTINDDDDFIARQIEVVQGEALVVNCMVHLPHMPRHNMATVTSFLRTMQKLSPTVVTLVEEELGCSTAAAASYFSEALYHFHAIFDSLEACLPLEVEARMLVERVLMAPRIDSAISMWSQAVSPCAAYGVEVSEKYKWSTIMHSTGFKPLPLSYSNQAQARLLLGLHRDGFKLEERSHHLVLGWHMKPLYAASVWK